MYHAAVLSRYMLCAVVDRYMFIIANLQCSGLLYFAML